MKIYSRRLSGLVLAILIALPTLVSAVNVQDVLRVPDASVITRGEFIRAAIKLLSLDKEQEAPVDLPYARVPRAMTQYVRIAYGRGALETFGDELLLARSITRGQALEVLTELLGARSTIDIDYKDARTKGEKRAVRAAVENHWMEPLRDNLFGVRRMLTGKEGQLLLRKVLGEALGERPDIMLIPQSQKIRVKIPQEGQMISVPKIQIIEAIWGLIQREFLFDDRIDPDDAAYRAMEGIVESLNDPYTTFLRPLRSQSFQQQISGEVSGIGAQVEYANGILTIVTPLKGSPAERAGLLPGDQILEADGFQLSNIGFLEAVDKVRGKKGTEVHLKIRRNGFEFEVDVVRDRISLPEVVITWQGDIAIVEITQFGRITLERLGSQLAEVQAKDPKGLILDLRNNPGGLLTAAISVVGHFLPKGSPVVTIKSRNSERTDRTLLDPVIDTSLPMVLLVNDGSASASEIVAGALQDAKRATVVGVTTYGKGTVQQVLQFLDLSSLKMTIAEWFTPNGNRINGVGVEPDVKVENTSDRDEQLVKALELLR